VPAALAQILRAPCERISACLKESALAGGTVTFKLKTVDFRLRPRRLAHPAGQRCCSARQVHFTRAKPVAASNFGWSGSGPIPLSRAAQGTLRPCLTANFGRLGQLEHVMDQIRSKLGRDLPAGDVSLVSASTAE
jgi:hypothetical protein